MIDAGPYGVLRHPLYAGNLVTFSGPALYPGSDAGLSGVAVTQGLTLALIFIEERELRPNPARR